MSPRFFCFFFLAVFLQPASSARILAIMPYFGASHFFAFEQLFEELARKGHSMDVVSYVPRKTPVPNYRDISLGDLLNNTFNTVGFFDFNMFDSKTMDAFSNMMALVDLAEQYTVVHSLPEIIALANTSYDLVLIEMFNTNVFYGIAHKTGAPIIGLSSCNTLPWSADIMGVPSLTSIIPHSIGGRSYHMNFFERVMNTIEVWFGRAVYFLYLEKKAQTLAEQYLGPLPPLAEIAANSSLLLLHTHFSFLGRNAFPPSIVEVGGLNLKPLKPLAPDVEKLLNDSNGAIYFSMGSVLVGKSLSEKKKQMFINALGSSGKMVLWKQEEAIKNMPKNIVTRPWFSQRDILQHPKVELFISHCGNLGLTEGVDAGVPIICIPMYGDQLVNGRVAEENGFSIYVDYITMTEDKLKSAIKEILTNKRYKENAKKVQAAFRDRPLSPMDTAIYWIEYVLKHGPITRPPYAQLPIWQRESLDVMGFFFLIVILSVYIVTKIFTICCCKKKSVKKQKQS